MDRRPPGKYYGEMYGSLSQRVDAAAYRGKRIKFRAAIRIEVKGTGNQAYLWLRVMNKNFGSEANLFYDNMADRPITNSQWQYYEFAADVPQDADAIDYGMALVGYGKAWLDSVTIAVISKGN